jgi:hypothetical protein
MADALLTPLEAVAYLKLDQQGLQQPCEALRWLCRTGRLQYTKVGRYTRFRRAWLDELIDANAVKRGPGARRPSGERA